MSTTNRFTFTWKIENYSKLIPKSNDYFESDKFLTNYSGKHEWYLKFYSNGWEKKTDEAWCFLCRKAGQGSITVDCTFEIIDLFDKVLISTKMNTQTYENFKSWGISLTSIERLKKETKMCKEDVLTIRCLLFIQKPMEISSYSSVYKSQMKIGVNHVTFACCIKEPDSSDWSFTKEFIFTEITSLEFILTSPADDIVIEVKNKPLVHHGSLCVTCKMTLLDVIDVGQCSATDKYRFDNADSKCPWYFPTFFTKNTLKEKNCIDNGHFTVILEFFIPNGIDSTEDESQIKYKIISGVKSFQDFDATAVLQKDLKEMQIDKKHCDVSLKADEELFCAHKNILSSRSPIFRAMFDCEMLENRTNVVNITDLDSTTLDNFLHFLYTGTIVDGNCENILKLMIAADKYQVKSLTEKCAQILMSSLTTKNACDVIAIADMIKHMILKASVLKFIEKNAETILISEKWYKWTEQNNHLALEITSCLALQFAKKSQ